MPHSRLLAFLVYLFLNPLFAQETVKPWLGVFIDDGKNGVKIERTIIGTPAQKAGLQSGDIVYQLDDKKVSKAASFIEMIHAKGVGTSVTVHFWRNDKKMKKVVELVVKPSLLEHAKKHMIGTKISDIRLEDIKSRKPFSTNSLKGKPTILEFWATWCPSCVASIPHAIAFANENNKKINYVAVSSEEVKKQMKFLEKASLFNNDSVRWAKQNDGELSGKFMLPAIPAFVVLDKDGIIKFITIGAGSYMQEALDMALSLK